MDVNDLMRELKVDTVIRESVFWRTHKNLGFSIEDKECNDIVFKTEVNRDLIEWLLDRWRNDYQYLTLFNCLVNLGLIDSKLFLKHAKSTTIDSNRKLYFYIDNSNSEVTVIKSSFARFARRCGGIAIESYPVGDVVNGVPSKTFNSLLNECKVENGYTKAGISVYHGIYYLLKGKFIVYSKIRSISYTSYFEGDLAEKVDKLLAEEFPIALCFDFGLNSFKFCDIIRERG